MTTTPTNVRNYFKLELLIARSYVTLRQLFKNRYFLFSGGKVWDDSPSCGSNYSTNVIAKNKKINLSPVQKTSVSNGDSNEWDLTTLTALLLYVDRPTTLNNTQIQQLDQEDVLLKQLRDVRNKLAHHGSKSIVDVEFNRLWTELSTILVSFGEDKDELDKLKEDGVFNPSTQPINEENVKEASRLNSLGTHAYKDGKFSEAITLFTKATVLSGVSDHDRAVFYSNISSSRLALYEQQTDLSNKFEINDPKDQRYCALRDAKQARNLWSTWWKAHFCVGKVYATLNEHVKAINSLERALALDPANNKIQKALDESRKIHNQQLRQEHLNPKMSPRTIPEQLNELQQQMGIDPQQVRLVQSLLEEVDPSEADVIKGHKYEHGDVDIKQDYEQAVKYFAKAASQSNAAGLYNLARLTDYGLGVKKDHNLALKLFEQAAAQPPEHPKLKDAPNTGVAEAEHALGLRYSEGVVVHKNLSAAAYWYQRAIDHGCAESANNLATMYLQGNGVDKDIRKAEQLFELSARRGDPLAMKNLADLLIDKNDLQMAKIWYDRACECGNILARTNRDIFEKALQRKQQLIDNCSPNTLKMINITKNVVDSLKVNKAVYKQSDPRHIYDYNMLNEHASRGSITAKNMCNALEHFSQALKILMQTGTLTETEENTFVHELSECYRIEHIVAQFRGVKMRQRTDEIIDRVLRRCSTESNTTTSRLDEDARICYAVLNMDSHELIVKFLDPCKLKYPKSIYFFDLSAAVNIWLKRYDAALYEANIGLEVDSNYYELFYDKAVSLRLLANDMDETIAAYRDFLALAPEDHRKVPESYYAMASCYLVRDRHDGITDIVRKTYQQGEEAEKLQLPCFLPYESNNKTLLRQVLDPKALVSAEPVSPVNRKLHLSNPHRIEVILQHREWEGRILREKNNPTNNLISLSHTPPIKQQPTKSLVGLKPISLREMNPSKDHVYNGYVLSVTIIEEAYSWIPSIHLVIADEHLDCERMSIYGFSKTQAEYLINELYTIGSKMNIINPYLRIGAHDMKPLIRIDDFSSIVMESESERVLNMCRCCGEPNALHICSRCKQARYCTKECQTIDWKLYKHKLICKKQ
jgi:TPR repeat protein